jgi:hypothetical protein
VTIRLSAAWRKTSVRRATATRPESITSASTRLPEGADTPDGDFFVVKIDDPEAGAETLVEIVTRRHHPVAGGEDPAEALDRDGRVRVQHPLERLVEVAASSW